MERRSLFTAAAACVAALIGCSSSGAPDSPSTSEDLKIRLPWPAVRSNSAGFVNIGGTRPDYEYGPALVTENGTIYAFYCSSPTAGGWDTIRMSTSKNGQDWTAPTVALTPYAPFASSSVCDPAVVKLHGVYFMYYSCINDTNPPDGYPKNRICVAMADSIAGPYRPSGAPIIQDRNCSLDPNVYCVGQPSALVVNDEVRVYYTDDPGSGSAIYLQTSSDGVNFQPANGGAPVIATRNVDVKYDRASGYYFLVQGEVGSASLQYALSKDGIHWLPLSSQLAVNPVSAGGANHNPGLVADARGTFDGMTSVLYGSSYPPAGWGQWHLARTEVVLNPGQNDCSHCADVSCDQACSALFSSNRAGSCAVPGSVDPGRCCACAAVAPDPSDTDCHACAPQGCVTACRAASSANQTGYCAAPGSQDPGACCVCL
jgi:hypothetical protein